MASYDVVVLGSGPGGYVAAIQAAQHGLKSAVVEKDTLGGVCLNWGCIPTKSLIESATSVRSAAELKRYGVKTDFADFSYEAVHGDSRAASERLSQGVQHLLKKNGVEILRDRGTIISPREVRLAASGQAIEGSSIIVATGSREKEIPGFPFDGKTVVSSKELLAAKELPKDIAILGAGAIGVEFSYIFASLGVSVTLIELMKQVLPAEDEEVAVLLEQELRKMGVKVMTSTKALSCAVGNGGATLTLARGGQESTLLVSKVLVAVGRQPNSENIGLEGVGIATSRGFIETRDYYETNVPGVYAVGDVASRIMLAHVASRQGILAANHIAGKSADKRVDDALVPKAVYCEPQVASFGLSEKQAKTDGLAVTVSRFPFRGAGKAVATRKPEGFIKLVADSRTKEILGASIIGEQATEIIHELLLVKTSELVPEDITRTIHAHPTFSEALMEASRQLFGKAIHI